MMRYEHLKIGPFLSLECFSPLSHKLRLVNKNWYLSGGSLISGRNPPALQRVAQELWGTR